VLNYINIHIHNASLNNNILCITSLFHTELFIAENNSTNFYSIGIHPWQTENIDFAMEIQRILDRASLPNIIAIGECGIDKLKGADLQTQIKIFEAQIDIAEKVQKPLIIHCVKAFDEIIEIKRRKKPKATWIIHGFRQSPELAKQLINEGFILSFGLKALKNEQLTPLLPEILKNNTFFLETDTNESAAIIELYSLISEIIGISEKKLAEQLLVSFENIFKTNVNTYQ